MYVLTVQLYVGHLLVSLVWVSPTSTFVSCIPHTWMTVRDCNWLPIRICILPIFVISWGSYSGALFNETDTCWKLTYYAYSNTQNNLWKAPSGLRHLHCHQQVLFLSPIIIIVKHVSNSYHPSPSNRCCLPFPHEWLRAVCILCFREATDSTCICSNSCHTHTYTLCIYKLIWMYPVSWRSEVCVSRGKCSIVKVLFPPCWRWRVVLQGRSAHPLINSTHTSASTHTGIFEYTLTPHHLHHYITTTTSYTVPIYSPSRPLTHPSTQS